MSNQSIPRGDLGVRPPSEEKILRMRQGLLGGSSPRKATRGGARSFETAQADGAPLLSAAAVELATAYDNMPESRVEFVFGHMRVGFNARVWYEPAAGTALLCTRKDQCQINPVADGTIYNMFLDGRPMLCLFLGVHVSLGLTMTLLPIKVVPDDQNRTTTPQPQAGEQPAAVDS